MVSSIIVTWDDGHNDHVEHVVQQECDGHGDEDQLPLVGGLLQRVPPFLTILSDGLAARQEGNVKVVDAHGDGLYCLVRCLVPGTLTR